MTREEMYSLFGGAVRTADAMGVTMQSMYAWGDPLKRGARLKVLGRCVELGIKVPKKFIKGG